METIKKIESVFPSSQLYFCFFDDLAAQPANFVAGILSFLGVDADEIDKNFAAGGNKSVRCNTSSC